MNQPHNSINKQDSHKKTHVDSDKKTYDFVVSTLMKSVSPLKLYEPVNLIIFLAMYSPIFIAITMLSASFITKSM
jgi:hypothetical protein